MKLIRTLAVVWLASAPVTFGIFNGSFRGDFADLNSAAAYGQGYASAETHARQTCGAAVAFAIVGGPITLALSYLLSGFAIHGLSYNCDATP